MFDVAPADWEAIRLSLKVGAWSVAGSLPLGFLLAYAFSRYTFPFKSLITAVIHLPLVLPPVVTGFALLLLFGTRGPLGHFLSAVFGITIAFRWTGAAVAAAIMGLPLMVRAMRLSIDAVDRRLETAAHTLGAGRWRAFLTITLPLSLPGILAGAILSFAKSFGEFGATITFVSNIPGETRTVPIAIYSLLQSPGGEAPAIRLAVISVIISLAAVLGADAVERRYMARKAG
ncbi:MAG: molybdate ABC transporter permease subunit [Rhodospirillaceae bacterium]|nr:MAG: molybdate ABC transporter permease subunit [Rhodospirillaceae bacterium]